MAVDSKKMLEAFKTQLEVLPNRVPGYRDEAFNTIADIIRDEKQHQIQSTTIQKNVNDYCDRLGEILHKRIDD